jgi:hypothetical protein
VILPEGEFVGVEFDEAEQVTLDVGAVSLPARATAGFGHLDADDLPGIEILFGDYDTG